MISARGFTLLEMLAALSVFALIAALTYGAVVPATGGFSQLEKSRHFLELEMLAARRIRLDVTYLSPSMKLPWNSIKIRHDVRSGRNYDELRLLVRAMGAPNLTLVRYRIDEKHGQLVRESRPLLAREGMKAARWVLGKADEFEVQALGPEGLWWDTWDLPSRKTFPRALRVRWRLGDVEKVIFLPVYIEKI